MEKDWVKIYSSSIESNVLIQKQMLENNIIESVIINKQDSLYKAFGEIELYVLRDKVIKAKQLIGL